MQMNVKLNCRIFSLKMKPLFCIIVDAANQAELKRKENNKTMKTSPKEKHEMSNLQVSYT